MPVSSLSPRLAADEIAGSAPVGILAVDLQTRMIRSKPAAERIFGWATDRIFGRPAPLVPPVKRAELRAAPVTVCSGRMFPNLETYRRRRDASLVDVEIATCPVGRLLHALSLRGPHLGRIREVSGFAEGVRRARRRPLRSS
jgi:PAS domain S-box-containing protein